MFIKTLFLVFLFNKVKSQLLCGCPNSIPAPIFANSPSCLSTPVPQTSVIVDNSVSLGLANAVQLLIVSNLIESTIPAVFKSQICACERPVPSWRPYEVFPDCSVPFLPSVEIVKPYMPIEKIPPRFFGGCVETVSPACGIYDGYPNYYGMTETLSPNLFGWTEVISPTPCGFTEIISPCSSLCSSVTSSPIVTMSPSVIGVSEVPVCQSLPFPSYFSGNEFIGYPPSIGLTELLPTPVLETYAPVACQLCNTGNIMPCFGEVIESPVCGCGNIIYF